MGKGEGDGGRELRNLGVEREGKFLSSFLMICWRLEMERDLKDMRVGVG